MIFKEIPASLGGTRQMGSRDSPGHQPVGWPEHRQSGFKTRSRVDQIKRGLHVEGRDRAPSGADLDDPPRRTRASYHAQAPDRAYRQ